MNQARTDFSDDYAQIVQATYMVDPPFCLEAVGLAFMAPEEPLAALAALLAALRAFTSLMHKKQAG